MSIHRLLCSEFLYGVLWHKVTQLIGASQLLAAIKPGSGVWIGLFLLAIYAPARADKPCSGSEDYEARPIAATLQSNASVFDPNGRFEVKSQLYPNITADITIRHSVGNRELFRSITRLKSSFPESVVIGKLPVSEGFGFSLEIAEGGSGLTHICTYGFRFQQGVVSYRTLAARMVDRDNVVVAVGDVTGWKSVSEPSASLTQPNSPRGNAPLARPTAVVTAESIDARIARLRKIASTQQPYLYDSTGAWSDVSIVARDLPSRVAGFTDYRTLYDQLYFAAIQYTGLASH